MYTRQERKSSETILQDNGWITVSLNRFIDWRAKRIDDPLKRLRYLRSATSTSMPARRFAHSFRLRRIHLLAAGSLLAFLVISAYTISKRDTPIILPVPQFGAGGARVFPNVWLVDRTEKFEMYSNGLRIENSYAVSNEPRGSYPVFGRRHVEASPLEWRSNPAGIVYHTTESNDVPFEPEEAGKLQRVGANVLDRTRQYRSYHFVIDRFGRVFRIVKETDAANHAGWSLWGDDRVAYINLNSSFLGVAFETQTQQGELPSANAAQIHSARVLTEMLRSKYHIPASNCVTHAQVSVNPDNYLVGYHTDWASNFPFSELGLDDNYLEPPASIDTFGFSYDSTFINATGTRIWQGLILAEEQVRAQALSQGLSVGKYRKVLHQKYKEILAAVKTNSAVKEKRNAT